MKFNTTEPMLKVIYNNIGYDYRLQLILVDYKFHCNFVQILVDCGIIDITLYKQLRLIEIFV